MRANHTITEEDTDRCAECVAGYEHCHDVSIEHADGATECMDRHCTVDHRLHSWQLSCASLVPPCSCSPEEATAIEPWPAAIHAREAA